MTNLYDLPFEQRIRIKYFILGACLGMSFIGFIFFVGGITGYATRLFIMNEPLNPEVEKWILRDISLFGVMLLFIPLALILWYSKSKPKKYEHLNETVGLKSDWEKVKDI